MRTLESPGSGLRAAARARCAGARKTSPAAPRPAPSASAAAARTADAGSAETTTPWRKTASSTGPAAPRRPRIAATATSRARGRARKPIASDRQRRPRSPAGNQRSAETGRPAAANPPRSAIVPRPASAARPQAAAQSHRRRRTATAAAASGKAPRRSQGQSGGVACPRQLAQDRSPCPSTTTGTDHGTFVRPWSADDGAQTRASAQANVRPVAIRAQVTPGPGARVPTSRRPCAVSEWAFAGHAVRVEAEEGLAHVAEDDSPAGPARPSAAASARRPRASRARRPARRRRAGSCSRSRARRSARRCGVPGRRPAPRVPRIRSAMSRRASRPARGSCKLPPSVW